MCKANAQQIQQDGAVIGTAMDNLSAALKSVDPALSANLATAGAALVAATANWKEGDTLDAVADAEQVAIVALNAIPVTSTFAPLVAIVFTALNLLIANAKTQSSQTGNVMADAHVLLSTEKTLNTDSPWKGKAVIKHHILNPPRKDFEAAYNEAAKPLGMAEITL